MSQNWTILRTCSKLTGSSTVHPIKSGLIIPKPPGHNTIGERMPTIAALINMIKRYCLRATAITILDDGSFASHHIITVTVSQSCIIIDNLLTPHQSQDYEELLQICRKSPLYIVRLRKIAELVYMVSEIYVRLILIIYLPIIM